MEKVIGTTPHYLCKVNCFSVAFPVTCWLRGSKWRSWEAEIFLLRQGLRRHPIMSNEKAAHLHPQQMGRGPGQIGPHHELQPEPF